MISMKQQIVLSFIYGVITLCVVMGCQSNSSSTSSSPSIPNELPNDVALSYEIITKGSKKVLRASVLNNWGATYKFKVSNVYYRQFETLSSLPVEVELEPGEKFVHDFEFHPDAWIASTNGLAKDVTAEFSGESAQAEFSSNDINYDRPAIGWNETGPDRDKVFFDDDPRQLPRTVEIQITSIKQAGLETLKGPMRIQFEPGTREPIPGLSRAKKPTITYKTRLLPNQRWSPPEVFEVQ